MAVNSQHSVKPDSLLVVLILSYFIVQHCLRRSLPMIGGFTYKLPSLSYQFDGTTAGPLYSSLGSGWHITLVMLMRVQDCDCPRH